MPRIDTADFCRHIYRELNTVADRLADRYRNEWMLVPYTNPSKRIRAFFDGSKRGNKAAYGWAVFVLPTDSMDELSALQPIATKSCLLPDGASVTSAELEAASNLICFLHAYFHGYDEAISTISKFPTMDHRTLQQLTLAEMV